MLTHIARDWNTGEIFQLFSDCPRTELLKMFDSLCCQKLYVDSKSGGQTFVTGWIIAGRCLQVYSVTEMREQV